MGGEYLAPYTNAATFLSQFPGALTILSLQFDFVAVLGNLDLLEQSF